MYVSTMIEAPNGVSLTVHRVGSINITPTEAVVTVRSYANLNVKMIGWEERVSVPFGALSSDPIRSTLNALIASGGYLAGGALIEEAQ